MNGNWLERLRQLPDDPCTLTGDGVLDGVRWPLTAPVIPAAVLIPLIAHDTPTVLLTQRASHLPHHAGQVCFPGGRVDERDGDAVATALREAWEEIGLASERVEIVGRRPDYVIGTGFRVTPIVGVIQPPLHLTPDAREVDAIFEVPLEIALNPLNYQAKERWWRGERRIFYEMNYQGYLIWGATAAMLRLLGEAVFPPPP